MKTRNGFVSNSSSSSFCIPINALKSWQIEMIKDHIDVANKYLNNNSIDKDEYGMYDSMGVVDTDQAWNIEVRPTCVYGWTSMDNFDMHYFLTELIKVPREHMLWGDDWGGFSFSNEVVDSINLEILQKDRKDKLNRLSDNE